MESDHSHHSNSNNLSVLLHSLVDCHLDEPTLRELLRTWGVPTQSLRGDRTAERF